MTRYGQHFLIDYSVARREVSYAKLTPSDIVLEIGPGKGVLTGLIAAQAKKVIAVEIDPVLVADLHQSVPSNVELIQDDILTCDLSSLPRFTKVVSNLPFEISSPITFKLLKYPFFRAILIYQKEFADRMIAHPNTKQYSRLSVGVYYKTRCRCLEHISKTSFSPQPKVDASLLELIPRSHPPFTVADEAFFFELVKLLFMYRRKTIRTSIRDHFGRYPDLPFLERRPGELTPEQLGELSTALYHQQ